MSFVNIPRPEKKAVVAETVKSLSDIDKAMLNELLSIFNRNFISFYTNHDFKGSFRAENWNALSRFIDTWDDVTHEFVDEELESQKMSLYERSAKLGNIISMYSSPISMEFYSVYPSQRNYNEEERLRFKSEAEEINKECTPFVDECEKFIRYARKRLSES